MLARLTYRQVRNGFLPGRLFEDRSFDKCPLRLVPLVLSSSAQYYSGGWITSTLVARGNEFNICSSVISTAFRPLKLLLIVLLPFAIPRPPDGTFSGGSQAFPQRRGQHVGARKKVVILIDEVLQTLN